MKEFQEFKKIPRLTRECVITEKIDGTNGCVYIGEDGEFLVGSRSRWITPETDNYGFARWCIENKEELMKLGAGVHYGEWWGSGIQRGYGLPKGEKRWSLFNVGRWCLYGETPKIFPTQDPRITKTQDILPKCCGLVPVLWEGIFNTFSIDEVLNALKNGGSKASPNFMNPEGIVIYHKAGNMLFKKTIEKDEEYKSKGKS